MWLQWTSILSLFFSMTQRFKSRLQSRLPVIATVCSVRWAGLMAKFLQVSIISLCDRNIVLLIFCPAWPSWYGHHSSGHANTSQFRVPFSSTCLFLSSPSQHTHGGSALQVQCSREAFLKKDWNPLLCWVDGKKWWNCIETRAVPVPQKRRITLLHLPKWP